MMEPILFVAILVALVMVISPRLFLYADRLISRLHLQQCGNAAIEEDAVRSMPSLQRSHKRPPIDSLSEYAHLLDSLARAVRSNSPARDALIEMLAMMQATSATTGLHEWLLQGKDIPAGLQRCERDNPESRLFSLLQHSLVQGVFIPSALEQSAAILRDESRHQNDVITATAQTRSSARILTLLPFVVLLLLFLASSSTRREMTKPPVMIVLAFGVVLNRLGWHWVRQLVSRSALTSTGIAAQLCDEVVVSLRAGISMRQSIENWAYRNDPHLSLALSTGQPLSQALQEFSLQHDSDAQLLAQILIDAERDGLPVVDTIHRLSSEMRSRRRHDSEVKLRQLPTKLAMPVVFCILPSFIFLSVLPLVISNLQHFQFSPPPTSVT